jgi:hypothetical protein
VLYVQLDTNWPDHPKIIEAGLDGRGLHATVLCLAKRLEKDGWVPLALLRREGATDELIERLIGLRLLERDGDRFRPWDWLSRNPSQAAIEAKRAAKAEAGRRGNHARHGHDGAFENCRLCNPKPQVVAPCENPASHPEDGAVASSRIPTQTEPTPALSPGLAAASPPEETMTPDEALTAMRSTFNRKVS